MSNLYLELQCIDVIDDCCDSKHRCSEDELVNNHRRLTFPRLRSWYSGHSDSNNWSHPHRFLWGKEAGCGHSPECCYFQPLQASDPSPLNKVHNKHQKFENQPPLTPGYDFKNKKVKNCTIVWSSQVMESPPAPPEEVAPAVVAAASASTLTTSAFDKTASTASAPATSASSASAPRSPPSTCSWPIHCQILSRCQCHYCVQGLSSGHNSTRWWRTLITGRYWKKRSLNCLRISCHLMSTRERSVTSCASPW